MPRPCAACRHPEREAIDARLTAVPLPGGLRALAKRYNLSLNGLSSATGATTSPRWRTCPRRR